MATTVTANDLSISVSDNVTLNSVAYGGTASAVDTGVNEIDQRIVNVALKAAAGTATWTDLFSFRTTNDLGQGILDEFKYFRVTNLDDTNYIILQFIGTTATNEISFYLPAGKSMIITSLSALPHTGSSPTSYPTLSTIALVRAAADTAAVDVEYVAAFARA